ncbi:pilus assembly FimT family protein [Luteibacter yeojuensis]|uniref:pilus assembly FimT family protein n=1 Tax=Luteibacter yeojuensis TaxID=345309 RepID=UPI0006969629|nr:GspH/FimT family pseudopilin [Luteibacter yeojuensis]
MPRHQRAFTLTELAVTLLIVALASAMAYPAMGDAIAARRARLAADALADDLASARRSAIARGGGVAVCPSPDARRCAPGAPWHHGWLVVHGTVILAAHDALPARLASSARGGRDHMRFDEAGASLGDNTTVTLCVRKRPATAESVVLSAAGKVRRETAGAADAAACAAGHGAVR